MLNLLRIILPLFLFFNAHQGFSQCATPPLQDSCQGTEPLVVENDLITSSQKKWYYGATASLNSLTLRGGTLVVCGNLTVSQFFMDSGTVVVRPGARLVIGNGIGYGMVLKGNSELYNYGTLEIQRNLSLDYISPASASPNIVFNAPGAFFKMSNQYFVLNNPNSFFINKGLSEFHGIITDPAAAAGAVCLGFQSRTRMTVMYNRKRHSYSSPEGGSCLNVSEYTQLYDTVTNTPDLNVCLGPTHRMETSCTPWGCRPNAWGTPTTFNNCGSCDEITILPVKIFDFYVVSQPTTNQLRWRTDIAAGNHLFIIERSADGKRFATIDTVFTHVGNQMLQFTSFDRQQTGNLYYRIKCVNTLTGAVTMTPIVKATSASNSAVYPNPFGEYIYIPATKMKQKPELYDQYGNRVKIVESIRSDPNYYRVRVTSAGQGMYILRVRTENETESIPLIRAK